MRKPLFIYANTYTIDEYVEKCGNSNHAIVTYLKVFSKRANYKRKDYIDAACKHMVPSIRKFLISKTNLNTLDKMILFKSLVSSEKDSVLIETINSDSFDEIKKFKNYPNLLLGLTSYHVSDSVLKHACKKKIIIDLIDIFSVYSDDLIRNINTYYLNDGQITAEYMEVLEHISKKDFSDEYWYNMFDSNYLKILFEPFNNVINNNMDSLKYLTKRKYLVKFMKLLPQIHRPSESTDIIRKKVLESNNIDAITLYFTYNDFKNIDDNTLLKIAEYSWGDHEALNMYDGAFLKGNVIDKFISNNANELIAVKQYIIFKYFKDIDLYILKLKDNGKIPYYTNALKKAIKKEIENINKYINKITESNEVSNVLYKNEIYEVSIDEELSRLYDLLSLLRSKNDSMYEQHCNMLTDSLINIMKYNVTNYDLKCITDNIRLLFIVLSNYGPCNKKLIDYMLKQDKDSEYYKFFFEDYYSFIFHLKNVDENTIKKIADIFLDNPDKNITYKFIKWYLKIGSRIVLKEIIDKRASSNKNELINAGIFVLISYDQDLTRKYFKNGEEFDVFYKLYIKDLLDDEKNKDIDTKYIDEDKRPRLIWTAGY